MAKDKNIELYVDKFQHIAISEMERTGVPASIKLAQGILESNAGRSTLARKANNHFGIKCGSRWNGKKYYQKDDDYKKGKLVKSCFRGYKDASYSYLAHSDFLLDNKRYGDLFKLEPTNYKKWAKGLKKAGYATSKTYDKKLIRIIEEYQLNKFDNMVSSDVVAKAKTQTKNQSDIFYINDAKMTFVEQGETVADIAKRTKTNSSRILKYNELITSTNELLTADTKVFLQEKRKNFRGKEKVHIVKTGETMYAISQIYGLRLTELYKKNNMTYGKQPAIGESIRVRGKNKKTPKLRKAETNNPPPPVNIEDKESTKPVKIESEVATEINEEEAIIEVTEEAVEFQPILTPKEKEATKPVKPVKVVVPVEETPEVIIPTEETTPEIDTPPQIETRRYHRVVKGETLWRISRNYGTTVEAIQQLNNLNTKIIQVGMRLRIE